MHIVVAVSLNFQKQGNCFEHFKANSVDMKLFVYSKAINKHEYSDWPQN